MSDFIETELNNYLEQRLEEWALWCCQGGAPSNLGFASPYESPRDHSVYRLQRDVISNPRAEIVETYATELFQAKPEAAEVLRAHYRAHPKYGDALRESGFHNKKWSQLGIGKTAYYKRLGYAHNFMLAKICSEVSENLLTGTAN